MVEDPIDPKADTAKVPYIKKSQIFGEKPIDTEQHDSTRIKGKASETTVFKFRDPRKAKLAIFRGYERVEFAVQDTIRKTNIAINKGEIIANQIDVGDIVQACVVSYALNDKVYKPETTPDSPLYATLPYELIRAEDGGYLTTRVAIPPEMAIHLTLPEIVGDLIPILGNEEKQQVFVTLQLKETTKISKQEELEEVLGKLTGTKYELSGHTNEQAEEFENFLKETQDQEPVAEEWSDLTQTLEETASASQKLQVKDILTKNPIQIEEVGSIDNFDTVDQRSEQERKQEKIRKKIEKTDQENFGFNL